MTHEDRISVARALSTITGKRYWVEYEKICTMRDGNEIQYGNKSAIAHLSILTAEAARRVESATVVLNMVKSRD